jgi:hypothetical protein
MYRSHGIHVCVCIEIYVYRTGVFGAASKISKSLGKSVAILSFDDDFVDVRQRLLRKGGFVAGLRCLYNGLYSPLRGILFDPFRGVCLHFCILL